MLRILERALEKISATPQWVPISWVYWPSDSGETPDLRINWTQFDLCSHWFAKGERGRWGGSRCHILLIFKQNKMVQPHILLNSRTLQESSIRAICTIACFRLSTKSTYVMVLKSNVKQQKNRQNSFKFLVKNITGWKKNLRFTSKMSRYTGKNILKQTPFMKRKLVPKGKWQRILVCK